MERPVKQRMKSDEETGVALVLFSEIFHEARLAQKNALKNMLGTKESYSE